MYVCFYATIYRLTMLRALSTVVCGYSSTSSEDTLFTVATPSYATTSQNDSSSDSDSDSDCDGGVDVYGNVVWNDEQTVLIVLREGLDNEAEEVNSDDDEEFEEIPIILAGTKKELGDTLSQTLMRDSLTEQANNAVTNVDSEVEDEDDGGLSLELELELDALSNKPMSNGDETDSSIRRALELATAPTNFPTTIRETASNAVEDGGALWQELQHLPGMNSEKDAVSGPSTSPSDYVSISAPQPPPSIRIQRQLKKKMGHKLPATTDKTPASGSRASGSSSSQSPSSSSSKPFRNTESALKRALGRSRYEWMDRSYETTPLMRQAQPALHQVPIPVSTTPAIISTTQSTTLTRKRSAPNELPHGQPPRKVLVKEVRPTVKSRKPKKQPVTVPTHELHTEVFSANHRKQLREAFPHILRLVEDTTVGIERIAGITPNLAALMKEGAHCKRHRLPPGATFVCPMHDDSDCRGIQMTVGHLDAHLKLEAKRIQDIRCPNHSKACIDNAEHVLHYHIEVEQLHCLCGTRTRPEMAQHIKHVLQRCDLWKEMEMEAGRILQSLGI
ncbi:hypothetical protein CYLTODRAFT_466052 [Cylindrobasidium torrendii FP15055 ss-10]|uniref:CxC6 like cysteine cluster associated with KDZ domain-containing protein n=1 Tax=Cylindrobasidium torrendii FP15055 ss-10 TaxID=1314674 RepID=A0A0D7B3W7_9AGAR|nr:hypothetical protein CYLTODRAFT_466052 [Cylindrobasidium torrendii FP15055 ss-10]